jgi:hypothetical protein
LILFLQTEQFSWRFQFASGKAPLVLDWGLEEVAMLLASLISDVGEVEFAEGAYWLSDRFALTEGVRTFLQKGLRYLFSYT